MQALQCLETINCIERLGKRRRKRYKPRTDPFSLDDNEFRKRYRILKSTARHIIDLVRDDLKLDERGCGTSPEMQVLIAIRCWGRQEGQQNTADLHGLSQATTSRICGRVACALAQHSSCINMLNSIEGE